MTVVSDPDDQQYDCIEVGNAEIDLNTVSFVTSTRERQCTYSSILTLYRLCKEGKTCYMRESKVKRSDWEIKSFDWWKLSFDLPL